MYSTNKDSNIQIFNPIVNYDTIRLDATSDSEEMEKMRENDMRNKRADFRVTY